ncbi:hypothetical protein BCD49_25875 [Pseudofrankia sp. EUN1h]|nr:hypothetical protein BCD49_25875 [Pseudofrankia sp. EUN1h]
MDAVITMVDQEVREKSKPGGAREADQRFPIDQLAERKPMSRPAPYRIFLRHGDTGRPDSFWIPNMRP